MLIRCEAFGTMYPSSQGEMAMGIARNHCDCQHQGGRGLALSGMANQCEPLINIVMANKPKVLKAPKGSQA